MGLRRCMICGLLRGTQIRSWISAPVSFVVVLVTDEDLVSSHYVCVSLTEDQCGVVQRDIPKIREAIARFLGEVDKWHAEISAASSLTVTAASVDSSPALTTFLTWGSSFLLFELSTTISHLIADPNTVLVSGISTTDSPFPSHHFTELRNIASS